MTRFMNVLASVALITALAPIAANATTSTSLGDARPAAHTEIFGSLPDVQHVVACNVAPDRQTTNDTVVTSGGWRNQRWPESFGG
jgi:hypothetical protein